MDKILGKTRVFFLHNVIAPYMLPFFEELSKKVNLHVYFCKAQSEGRLWNTSLKQYSFKYDILKHISIGKLVFNYSLAFKLFFNKYDVYIVGDHPENILSEFIVFFMAKIFKRPFILCSEVIERKYYDKKLKKLVDRYLVKLFQRFFYRHSDFFIACSERTKRFLLKNGSIQKKIYRGFSVIPESQLKEVSVTKEEMGFKDKKVVLFLSYLVQRKGAHFLINAFKKMNRNDTVLIIAGTGKEEDRLKSMALNYKDIYFTGYINSQEEKAKYYSIADIFVLPSLEDVWGLVVNEAMYYGLPIIVTKQCACSEELIDGNGFIINAGNESELQIAMERLLDDDELRLKMGARSKEIIKNYRLDLAVYSFEEVIYYSIISKYRSSNSN